MVFFSASAEEKEREREREREREIEREREKEKREQEAKTTYAAASFPVFELSQKTTISSLFFFLFCIL
jgi:hypothetical protein